MVIKVNMAINLVNQIKANINFIINFILTDLANFMVT